MADYASDPKVEDVLSSVRRLVSQEIPKRPAAKPEADDGALLLTSKDRISEEHGARVAAKSLEQRVAELEKAVDEGTEEFEPDGSEDQLQHRPDRIVFTRPRSTEIGAERTRSALRLSEIALIETGPAQEAEPKQDRAVEFRRSTSNAAPEAPMAEDVPTLPPSTAEVLAFSDPDDVVARIEARIERGGPEPVPEAKKPETAEPAPDHDFDAALTAAVRASLEAEKQDPEDAVRTDDTLRLDETLSVSEITAAPVAEVEVNAADDAPRPAHEEDEDAVGEAVTDAVQSPLSTAKVAAVLEETSAESQPTPAEAAENALDALPEEEALRLLVARLMREELRGALGERITRNVRKLVRSEVKRVLESRALD